MWILDFANKHLHTEKVKVENFYDITGEVVSSMTQADWLQRDAEYGGRLYEAFHKLMDDGKHHCLFAYSTRKSSCMTARGILPAALHTSFHKQTLLSGREGGYSLSYPDWVTSPSPDKTWNRNLDRTRGYPQKVHGTRD